MRVDLLRFLLTVALWMAVFLSLFGCNLFSRTSKTQVDTSVPGTSSSVDASETRDEISKNSLTLLKKHDFVTLEKNANGARQNRERLVGGYWKLETIYKGLENPNFKQNSADTEWQILLANLEAWKETMPTSVTARVALANAWISYAGEARGDGFANTVSDENWKLFFQRLSYALTELNGAKDLTPKCPEWYVAMLDIALGQSWERQRYDKVFEEGFGLEPTYYPLQREKIIYLLPQWNGKEGEISDFIEQNSGRIQGEEGDIMRYLLTTTMQPMFKGDIFRRIKIPWPKLKIGYELLKKTYSVDSYRKNQFAYLAMYGQDVESAYSTVEEIGDIGDPEVWSTQDFYSKTKTGLEEFHKHVAATNSTARQ